MKAIFCAISLFAPLFSGCLGPPPATLSNSDSDPALAELNSPRALEELRNGQGATSSDELPALRRVVYRPDGTRANSVSGTLPGDEEIPLLPRRQLGGCLAELSQLDVSYRVAEPHAGIADPVEVTGAIGGVFYVPVSRKQGPLVLDCSLVFSLALAAPVLTAHGIYEAHYSSAYQVRNIARTDKPSKHSYGLALDIHQFIRADEHVFDVEADYQKGLGTDEQCVGNPSSEGGAVLRSLFCRFVASELFHLILTPDYNYDHRNHFHVEVASWDSRTQMGDSMLVKNRRRAVSE